MTVKAIYEHGVFRPTSRVDLPEKSEVVFEPQVVGKTDEEDQEAIYAILRQRYNSGEGDVAERHNEHQP